MSFVKALWLGRMPYLKGLAIQEKLFDVLNNNKNNAAFKNHYLCLFEHDPVYTVGLRDRLYSAEEEQRLLNLGADFVRIKRGGMITFHGPGQLVAYPLFDLKQLRLRQPQGRVLGVRVFVESIEEIIIRLCSDVYDIPKVGRTNDTGVWVDSQRKIAAIGIQVRHGITSHGLALNCNTDLAWFDHITPCGIEGKEVTSLSKERKEDISIEEALSPFCEQVETVFDCDVHLVDASIGDLDRVIEN
uniref:Octanoyl-[acyl-carrier-protein]:protein N-octanoyltransferase LIPT2, mitochondrial n=1 Tax=Panagrellus redivivus TaxID=6233 RepID=A0A7E4W5R4_PANRE